MITSAEIRYVYRMIPKVRYLPDPRTESCTKDEDSDSGELGLPKSPSPIRLITKLDKLIQMSIDSVSVGKVRYLVSVSFICRGEARLRSERQ